MDVIGEGEMLDELSIMKTYVPIYEKEHCWQYDIRLRRFEEDLQKAELLPLDAACIKVSDFDFRIVTDRDEKRHMQAFIETHEWLGNISQYTTHWFACYYKDILAGVMLFNMPNSFSKLLGEETPKLERLISRGACISWSPKNLASHFLMWCIRWMVKNTTYRLFTAYADPQAMELGTIYQACNFYYLGNTAGTTKRYVNPYTGKVVSDRFFRSRSAYRRYGRELGIDWQKGWVGKTGMNWDAIPDDIEKQLRDYARYKQSTSQSLSFPSKHKYAYVLGSTPGETKLLRKQFLERNKTLLYPKERGK